MVKAAISFLLLGAACSFLVLLSQCWDGCRLTTVDLLMRWSSGIAGVVTIAWLWSIRKGR